jgi:protein required for attachment to host cells
VKETRRLLNAIKGELEDALASIEKADEAERSGEASFLDIEAAYMAISAADGQIKNLIVD